MNEVFKTSIQAANAMERPSNPRRTIRDLDDGQSHVLPDLTPQEFIDGLKSGKLNYHDLQKKGDSALFENLGDAIMGELNMSPEDYGKLINDNYAFHKAGSSFQWNNRYLDAWKKWNEGGRPKTDTGDWNWDFYSNYSPNGYLRWYRPQDQWGRADHIRTKNEWEDFNFNGLHKEFDPFQSGYETSRKSWNDFLTGPWGPYANPKFNKIIEWLDKNKEYF